MIIDRVKSLASVFAYAIAVAAALPVTAPSAHADAQVTNCATTKVTHAYIDGQFGTSVQSFQNIPSTSFVFAQGGAAPSCVIIEFFASAQVTTGDVMDVKVTLDGQTLGLPPQVNFAGDTNVVSAAASFFFPSVAPGVHRVRILYRSASGAGVSITYPRTIVHHR